MANKTVIRNKLKAFGIQPRHLGYHYLVDLIDMVLAGKLIPYTLTKWGYPTIARDVKKTPGSVERAVRVAIQSGFNSLPDEQQQVVLNSLGVFTPGMPTNTQFIFGIADCILDDLDDEMPSTDVDETVSAT